MSIPWSLVIEIGVIAIVVAIILALVRGVIRIIVLGAVIVGAIWAYGYFTSPGFSADKMMKDLGQTVKSITEMAPALVAATDDTMQAIKDTGSKISLKENGLTFEGNKNELKGSIGTKNGHVRLYMDAPVADSTAIKNMIKIITVFSGDKSIGDKIQNLAGSSKDARIDLDGESYIELKKDRLYILRERT